MYLNTIDKERYNVYIFSFQVSLSEVTSTADRLTPSSGPLWLRDLEKIGL